MPHTHPHPEKHYIHRAGWLRAAVLGANDGLISTASLIVGVASASQGQTGVFLAGFAGLVAGAMSMAAGEYVSVSSQADIEAADLAREAEGLAARPETELSELAHMFMARGAERATAFDVAKQLSDHDVLAAHAREELGIHALTEARPMQAAVTSALTFSAGAVLPIFAAWLSPSTQIVTSVVASTLVFLAFLGAIGARAGGAPLLKPTIRVLFWGAAAMGFTALVGHIFGSVAIS